MRSWDHTFAHHGGRANRCNSIDIRCRNNSLADYRSCRDERCGGNRQARNNALADGSRGVDRGLSSDLRCRDHPFTLHRAWRNLLRHIDGRCRDYTLTYYGSEQHWRLRSNCGSRYDPFPGRGCRAGRACGLDGRAWDHSLTNNRARSDRRSGCDRWSRDHAFANHCRGTYRSCGRD